MSVIPMKADADFEAMERQVMEATERDLRQWLAEVEAHEAAKADVVRDIKDSYLVAKSRGFNVKALKRLVAERKRDRAAEEEIQAALDLYKRFAGMV